MLKQRINSYIAVLCITVVGAAAALLIMRVAQADWLGSVEEGTAGFYRGL